jgi:bacterioferritin
MRHDVHTIVQLEASADPARSVRLLNLALAAEIVSWRRYTRHSLSAARGDDQDVAADFLRHAAEKQHHAERLARRIVELGGEPELEPFAVEARRAELVSGPYELLELVRENIVAECVVMDTYAEMVGCLEDRDALTRSLLEELLALGEAESIRLIRLLRAIGANRTPGYVLA